MLTATPDYVAARIRQRSPTGLPVVVGSTRVVAFGDVRTARVATLGLNPSKVEFLDYGGRELTGDERRLETLASLGVTDLASAPDETVARVFNGCNTYFKRRPYRWFDRLGKVLENLGASYVGGSACHLDLVQWATDPTWGGLSPAQRRTSIASDIDFLRRQLENEHVRLLLLNGKSIVRGCEKWLEIPLREAESVVGSRVRMFTGNSDRGVRVIGWNINLQSSFGVTNTEIAQIGELTRRLAAADNPAI